MDDLFYDWGVMVEDLAVIDIDPKYRTQSGDLIIRHFSEHPISNLLLEYEQRLFWANSTYSNRSTSERPAPSSELSNRHFQAKLGRKRLSHAITYNSTPIVTSLEISIATASMRSARTELGISILEDLVTGNSDFLITEKRMEIIPYLSTQLIGL